MSNQQLLMVISMCVLCVNCEIMPNVMNNTMTTTTTTITPINTNKTDIDAKSSINERFIRSFDGVWLPLAFRPHIQSPLHTWFALQWNDDDDGPIVRIRPASPYWEDYQNDIKPIFQDVPSKFQLPILPVPDAALLPPYPRTFSSFPAASVAGLIPNIQQQLLRGNVEATNTPARLRSPQIASLLGYSQLKTSAAIKSDPRQFFRSANSIASVADPKQMTSELRHGSFPLHDGPLPLFYLFPSSPSYPAPVNSQPSIAASDSPPIPVLAPPIYAQATRSSTQLPLPSSLRTW